MKADAVPLLALFEKKMRLEIPLFQRQYVWNREQQWEPLWEDIARKFTEYLEGRTNSPVHFLGAMVLDQKQTPSTHVEKRQVIDGQQRLTTLQLFLASFRDFCREQNCDDLAKECEGFTLNKGMMANPEIDKFKVWPTQLDRNQFMDVLESGSKAEIERKHPLVYRKYARKPQPRPKMVEAYLFFYSQLENFFIGSNHDKPLAAEAPLPQRLEECFQALKNSLRVVAIDLENEDDAQVIFETLNARGEPLLPADLLRNYIFLRAARRNEPYETLYNNYWRQFDDPFWRVEVKQGRLMRPRSDLFIQHFLSSRQAIDIPIKHLFVEYKFWIEREQPFASVEDELTVLSRQGEHFRRIVSPVEDDILHQISVFLDAFDVRTCYPLLLALLEENISTEEIKNILGALESYIIRRAICGRTTKNYNRIFLTIIRNLRREGFSHPNLIKLLNEQTGESGDWPTDADFSEAWRNKHAYQTLNNPKIVYIFKRLNNTYSSNKSEVIPIASDLSVEHILPQNWIEHWPLSSGVKGLTAKEIFDADPQDERLIATRSRNSSLQTFGNLTIVRQALNSSISNGAWPEKKRELRNSILPLNIQLQDYSSWDEESIKKRGNELLARAIKLWPRN